MNLTVTVQELKEVGVSDSQIANLLGIKLTTTAKVESEKATPKTAPAKTTKTKTKAAPAGPTKEDLVSEARKVLKLEGGKDFIKSVCEDYEIAKISAATEDKYAEIIAELKEFADV